MLPVVLQPGIWAGRGAERLGLRGPVQRSHFVALLRNENPTTGKRLTARTNTSRQEDGEKVSDRQVGYGLVFGVPKSLSIYLAITGDEVVENIARSAVGETMRAMESEMQCKVRKGGLHEDRRTGELLYSKFFHRDSRPINGLSDPHWHVHCFLHNATFDPLEERWKAGVLHADFHAIPRQHNLNPKRCAWRPDVNLVVGFAVLPIGQPAAQIRACAIRALGSYLG